MVSGLRHRFLLSNVLTLLLQGILSLTFALKLPVRNYVSYLNLGCEIGFFCQKLLNVKSGVSAKHSHLEPGAQQ
ncbi:hypothetical protein GE09DRAFT_1158137 [Coniochaeta sp. 2T2.1]|nr:hypothetical protein GE09DRAFT_1158137 [Coniochaeta sp. 2T2.1]